MDRRFGWVLEGKRQGPDPLVDIDLGSNAHASLVPSAGSLLPGWLLLIPRAEALSFAKLNGSLRNDLFGFAHEVRTRVSQLGHQTFTFEHGPTQPGSSLGCGVDQAHLHIVPANFDLVEYALLDQSVEWKKVSFNGAWRELSGLREYYYLASETECYVGYPTLPKRQYFRRLIADALGMPDKWDYRDWPFYENAQRTIDHYSCAPHARRAA